MNVFNLKSHKKLDPREYFLFNKRDVSSSFSSSHIPSGAQFPKTINGLYSLISSEKLVDHLISNFLHHSFVSYFHYFSECVA